MSRGSSKLGTDRKKKLEKHVRTRDDLRPLKVLVWMKIAGGQGKPQPNEDENQVCAPPHGWPIYNEIARLADMSLEASPVCVCRVQCEPCLLALEKPKSRAPDKSSSIIIVV